MHKELLFAFVMSIMLLSGCVLIEETPQDNTEDVPVKIPGSPKETVPSVKPMPTQSTPQVIPTPPQPNIPENAENKITLAAEKTESQVKLSWSRYIGDFKQYKVIKSTIDATPEYPGGEYIAATVPSIDTTAFTDTAPQAGISYYVVVALSQLNQKNYSNVVMVEFPDPKETPDQEMTIRAEKTAEGILLSWTKYEGSFLQYKIVRTQDHPYPKYPNDDDITTIPFVNTTSYLDRTAKPGTNYYAVTVLRPDKTKFTSSAVSVER